MQSSPELVSRHDCMQEGPYSLLYQWQLRTTSILMCFCFLGLQINDQRTPICVAMPQFSLSLLYLQEGKVENLFCIAHISENGRIQSHAFYTMGRSQLFRQMQLLPKVKKATVSKHDAHSRGPFWQEEWTSKSWAPPEYPIPGTNPSVTSEVWAPPLPRMLQFSRPQQVGSNPGNKAELCRKKQRETLGYCRHCQRERGGLLTHLQQSTVSCCKIFRGRKYQANRFKMNMLKHANALKWIS